MSRPLVGKFAMCLVIVMMVLGMATVTWGQATQGRVDVTVLDEKGAYVPAAKVVLRDVTTNIEITAQTQKGGSYSFVNLSLGKYKLSISKDGFQTSDYDVEVQSARTTSIEATLKVGQITQVVEVGAVSPVMDTTSNAEGQVINPKSIEDLPLGTRSLNQLATLTPGYTGGTWNGLPAIAQGNNVDGVMGSPSRMKFGGDASPSIAPRLENIEEMTIQTDSLDLNQGFGQSAMQINYTTRRGGNDFHGRLYEDFRNRDLNANGWRSNASGLPRPAFEQNEFGGAIGGHIIKDKLFFFGSFSTFQQPGGIPTSASVLTAAAQAGSFTYLSTAASGGLGGAVCNGTTCTVNLYTAAQNWNTANPGQTIVNNVANTVIGQQLAAINGVLGAGTVTSTTDPIINNLNFLASAPTQQYFPTFRVDYTPKKNLRFSVAYNETITIQPVANAPYFPGSAFASSAAGNKFVAYPGSLGIEWTISPTLVNQFNGGFLYNANFFGYNSPHAYIQTPEIVAWPLVTSPQNYYLPVISYYPVWNASDAMTWQHSTHAITFGFSFYREQDHYWNPPEGITNISLGLVTGDNALGPFTGTAYLPGANTTEQGEAQSLYSLLTGRVSSTFVRNTYQPSTNSYTTAVTEHPLDEVAQATGIFVQDSWRIRPSLTFNYGLRWDFTQATHDISFGGLYHNADESSLFGPSGIGNLFNPGVLTGNMNPSIDERPQPYGNWFVAPQPMVGFAWAPQFKEGILNKLGGNGNTVIRAGFSLRNFTVPYQYFWDDASDFGTFFYQFGTLTANTTGQVGTFAPGSLTLGPPTNGPAGKLPSFCTTPASCGLIPTAVSPAIFQKVAPESEFTFVGGNGSVGVNGFQTNIGQPYTMAWNFGIQHKFGTSRALEIRYNGNRTIHQWISENINEVNVFENGFLKEFQNAQSNLAICNANPAACLTAEIANGTLPASATKYAPDFANLGLPGQVNLPIMTGAFTGSQTGSQANSNFIGSRNSFITNLNTGAVGSFASSLTRLAATPYFCNLVGASFTPCATNAGYSGAGAGFPINFFQANPYASGSSVGMMTDAGYSDYHAMQVDFRQSEWHGMQFDANYTWSHTLGVSTPNDWTGAYPAFSLRNLRYGYGPTLFDLRHVVHIQATADLPFGKGRHWVNHGGVLDKVVGGWNAGTIFTYQSGFPFSVLGPYSTYNNIANGGVDLTGITKDQLQSDIGVYRLPGKNFVTMLPASVLVSATGGGANPNLITPNITPGIFAPPIYLTGPHGVYDDISLSKEYPITERWKFSFQTELLNAFNHPVFGNGTTPIGSNILSTSWATTNTNGVGGFGRRIEFRANIIF